MTVKTFTGRFYEVLVSSYAQAPRFRVHILPQPSAFHPDLTVVGIHCPTEEARAELQRLVGVANCLALYLENGGRAERFGTDIAVALRKLATMN